MIAKRMKYHYKCKCGTDYTLFTEGENGMMPMKKKMSANREFQCFDCGNKFSFKDDENENVEHKS